MNNATDKYIDMVMRQLADENGISMTEANVMVANSSFAEMIETDPEFVGHYPPEYWTDIIKKEHDI